MVRFSVGIFFKSDKNRRAKLNQKLKLVPKQIKSSKRGEGQQEMK